MNTLQPSPLVPRLLTPVEVAAFLPKTKKAIYARQAPNGESKIPHADVNEGTSAHLSTLHSKVVNPFLIRLRASSIRTPMSRAS